jgi:hypothetical protein
MALWNWFKKAPEPDRLTVSEIMENRLFFTRKKNRHGYVVEAEKSIDEAFHLFRLELFKLRMAEIGVSDDWVKQNSPIKVEVEDLPELSQMSRRELDALTRKLQSIEYLRSEVIVASARLAKQAKLARHRKHEAEAGQAEGPKKDLI